MTTSSSKIAEAAEQLTAEEQIALIERLLDGLHRVAPDEDREWTEEAERRLDAYLEGQVQGRSAAEVFADLRKAR